ncbi:ABC transporter permease [Nocardiopsis halophila]|uniref:ABC transporter permease n=1 Tax=Nocardiopsis halophila TaxID=141692 RepID=UPI000349F611|nr:ABC transporter permease [Nocardiopsis halophila]
MSRSALFLLRRLAGYACLLAAASSCAYLLSAAVLDPTGNYAAQQPRPSPEVVRQELAERNLDPGEPLVLRYAHWASDAVTGDLGQTWDGRPVASELADRAAASARLLVLGSVLGAVGGVAWGAWAGARKDGGGDTAATLVAVVLISVPPLVVAVVLQTLAVGVNDAAGQALLRTAGEPPPGAGPVDRIRYMVLPAVALALPLAAVVSRYQRGLMADEAGSVYVRTARAKGLTRGRALRSHALRTSLVPAATYVAYTAAAMFTGAVFVERVFGRHGVGAMLVEAVEDGDVNAAAAACAFGAACVVAAGGVADTLRILIDPRVRS